MLVDMRFLHPAGTGLDIAERAHQRPLGFIAAERDAQSTIDESGLYGGKAMSTGGKRFAQRRWHKMGMHVDVHGGIPVGINRQKAA